MTERMFRLALTIQDDPELKGAHVALALAEEEGNDTPVLIVGAGGFPPNDEGARLLAAMLEDAAEAIYEKVGRPTEHPHTESLPVMHTGPMVPKRPRFNPQPRIKKE